MSKRLSSIQESQSTFLFNDSVCGTPKDKKLKIVPSSPQLRQLLMRKIVVNPKSLNTANLSAIQPEKSTICESFVSSVPSAYEVIGISKEEDESNTLELKKMLNSNTTLDTIISLLSDESEEEGKQEEKTHEKEKLEEKEEQEKVENPMEDPKEEKEEVVGIEEDSKEEKEDLDQSHLSIDPDSLEITDGDMSVMFPDTKETEKENYSIINLVSDSETGDGSQNGSDSEDDESVNMSRLEMIVRNFLNHCEKRTNSMESAKPTESVIQTTQKRQSEEVKLQEFSDNSLSKTSIEVEEDEEESDKDIFDIESPIHNTPSIELPKRSLFTPISSPKRTESPTHSSISSPLLSSPKKKEVNSISRIPSISLSQQSNPLSPPLSQPSSSSRHRTLLVALEEELANSELGKVILDSVRPLYVIGPFIRSPIHGVCLVMRQVNDVLKIIDFDIGICND